MTPGEDLGGRGCPPEGVAFRVADLGGIEQAAVAQQHAQGQVAADQVRQVAVDLVGVHLVDQVGHQHHQGTLAGVRGQVPEGFVVAGFHQLGEAVEAGPQQPVHLVHAAAGRDVGVDCIGKADKAHGVGVPQGHVACHQHGVQGVVQQAQARCLVGHHPPAIDQKHDPLALGGLEILDGELPSPGGRPPVDVLVVVVHGVIAQALEVVVQADAAGAAHAHLAEPVGTGEDGVLAELFHVGIDVDDRLAGVVHEPLPQSQPAADLEVHVREGERAAAAGTQHVVPGGAATALHPQGELRRLGIQQVRHAVADRHRKGAAGMVRYGEAHRMPLPQRGHPYGPTLHGEGPTARQRGQVGHDHQPQQHVQAHQRPQEPRRAQEPERQQGGYQGQVDQPPVGIYP